MNAMAAAAQRSARILDAQYFGNTLHDWLVCGVAIAVGLTLIWVFRILVMRRLRKWFESTPSRWDDLVAATLEANAVPALYLLVIWLGLRDLYMLPALENGLKVLVAVAVTLLVLRMVLALAHQGLRSYLMRHSGERTDAKEKGIQGIITLAKFLIVLLAIILLLDNLGFKISAFVAGLGVTGIAVALAAQAILGDLFGYFVIFFDEPFEVGHTIKVGDIAGEVEHIGLKTTRLRGPEGEQIIFSNKFLTDNRIQNLKRMTRRRVTFAFEMDRATPSAVLRDVPERVKALLTGIPDVTFERTHLISLGEWGPRFEVSYVVETADFNRHLEVRQALNLGLYAFFQNAGARLAFPARAVYVRQDGGETSMRQGHGGPADPSP